MPAEVQRLKQLESGRIYGRTDYGLSAKIYAHIKSRTKGNKNVLFYDLAKFREWLDSTPYKDLHKKWEQSGYLKSEYPSIDRIDCLKGYNFDNMQVIPYCENRKKGEQEKVILWGKKIHQYKMEGELVGVYQSIKHAWQATGISRANISSVASGARNQAGGYKWEFDKNLKNGKNIIRIRQGVPRAFLRRR